MIDKLELARIVLRMENRIMDNSYIECSLFREDIEEVKILIHRVLNGELVEKGQCEHMYVLEDTTWKETTTSIDREKVAVRKWRCSKCLETKFTTD